MRLLSAVTTAADDLDDLNTSTDAIRFSVAMVLWTSYVLFSVGQVVGTGREVLEKYLLKALDSRVGGRVCKLGAVSGRVPPSILNTNDAARYI